MVYSISRSQMLELLANAMDVPTSRRSALLGRFQHLQRLSLVEGINPGRGKAAEYRAQQVMVIAVAFEMLQIGLTPERAVKVIKDNIGKLHASFGLAAGHKGKIKPCIIWFDPVIINGDENRHHVGSTSFHFAGAKEAVEHFDWFINDSWIERKAVISISGILWHIALAFEPQRSHVARPEIGTQMALFLEALRHWFMFGDQDDD